MNIDVISGTPESVVSEAKAKYNIDLDLGRYAHCRWVELTIIVDTATILSEICIW